MKIRPIFAWYDFWIGVFVDRKKHSVYFFPIPCLGMVISWECLWLRHNGENWFCACGANPRKMIEERQS